MKRLLKRFIRAMGYLLALGVVLAALLVSIAHLITPLLNQHRHDLEVWASRLLEVPITIGTVHADWRANIPELTLEQVVTYDKLTQKPAFHIREIKLGLQLFSSLWKREFVLQDIIISGAEVTVVEQEGGGFMIQDLPDQSKQNPEAYQLIKMINWTFSQPYLAMHAIDVHLLLQKGEKREFTINKLALSNQGEKHFLNGSFVLKQELPMEMSGHATFQGSVNDLDHLKAEIYLNLQGIRLGQWLNKQDKKGFSYFEGFQLQQGLGGADLWLIWESRQLREMQTVFQWYDLLFYSERDKKSYSIDRSSGHLGWKREGERQIIAGDNILINFPHHLWPATTFYLSLLPSKTNLPPVLESKKSESKASDKPATNQWQQRLSYAKAGLKQGFGDNRQWVLEELRLGYLNLQDVLPLVLANSALSQTTREFFTALAPSGELENMNLHWRASTAWVEGLSVSSEFRDLSVKPWQTYPGFMHAAGHLAWDGRVGQLQLNSKAFSLLMPTLFREPLHFEQVKAVVDFEHLENKTWTFQAKKAQASNEDLSVKTDFALDWPINGSPRIDLKANFSLAKLTQLGHYLPAKYMSKALVAWLEEAFLDGSVESGKAVIQGAFSDFPFVGEKSKLGRFEVSGLLDQVDFHYAPQWPLLEDVDGEIRFSGASMKAFVESATLLDIPVKNVSGVIPYLGPDQPPILTVDALLDTDLAQGLEFIHQSPLENDLGRSLANLRLSGPLHLNLKLTVPLGDPDKIKVLGIADIKQARLTLPSWNLTLDQLNGRFQFDEEKLSAKSILGSLFGEPTILNLSTVAARGGKPAYVEAGVSGRVSVPHLETALHLSLSQFMKGGTAYQALLKLYKSKSANNEVLISSNLEGLGLDLPKPYGKSIPDTRSLSLGFTLEESSNFKLALRYADLLKADLALSFEQNARLLDIDSPRLKGRIRLAYPFSAEKPIEADMERLVIDSGNEQTISAIDPRSIPPLSLKAQQFIHGKKELGYLVLNTVKQAKGMTIQNLNVTAADYTFQAKGQWVVSKQAQQSQLQGTIVSPAVNRFLDRLGLPLRSLIVNKGRASFDLQWKGAPYRFSLATISGNFFFALEKGRIVDLNEADNNKMDLGKMLSLFSLQTIPRRLSLDFSDLFEKGYSFDFMRGDFDLRQGSAFTKKPAVFEGPVAHVAASGRIGFLAQDYDLSLSVSPHVTESLPVVAGAITLNPLVGAAAWLVNKAVINKEVSRAITYNYKVTGSWNNPNWQKE